MIKMFRIIENGVAITKWHSCDLTTISHRNYMKRLMNKRGSNWYLEYKEVESND